MTETNICLVFTHEKFPHLHDNEEMYEKRQIRFGDMPGLTGPPCIWCNSPTRRAGVCWLCPMCGETTSC